MRHHPIALVLLVLVLAAPAPADPLPDDDRREIAQIVHDTIGWALTKDRARLESIIAHDEDYFSYHPEGLDGVRGYQQFLRGFDIWMDDRFVATEFDVRNLRIHLAESGDVAWFSAILDDCYEWDGQPGCWRDTRWTGVLERRDGRWVVMQNHFSFAADQVARQARERSQDGD
jgi:ketosteroid isomerase-like protein